MATSAFIQLPIQRRRCHESKSSLIKRGYKKEVIPPIDAPEAFTAEAAAERKQKKAEQVAPVVRALGLAFYWQKLLDEGKFASLTEIARAEAMDLGQASKLFRLTQLAPELVEDCLDGNTCGMSLESFTRKPLPVDWRRQHVVHKPPD